MAGRRLGQLVSRSSLLDVWATRACGWTIWTTSEEPVCDFALRSSVGDMTPHRKFLPPTVRGTCGNVRVPTFLPHTSMLEFLVGGAWSSESELRRTLNPHRSPHAKGQAPASSVPVRSGGSSSLEMSDDDPREAWGPRGDAPTTPPEPSAPVPPPRRQGRGGRGALPLARWICRWSWTSTRVQCPVSSVQ